MNIPEITEEERKAYDARYDCPISARKFENLCNFIADGPMERDVKTFVATHRFIKEHKLPKAKMMAWLDKYGVTSDFQVGAKLMAPICERVLLSHMTDLKPAEAEVFLNRILKKLEAKLARLK